MPILTSFGHEIDQGADAFGLLEESDPTSGVERLRREMDDQGYLLFRDVIDHERIDEARGEILEKLDGVGEVSHDRPLMEGVWSGRSRRSEIDERAFLTDLRTGEAYRRLCHEGWLMDFFAGFLGGPVRSFDYLWLRTVPPGEATGCHCDSVYMGRGTTELFTSWVPLGDVPMAGGALMLLERSHRLGELAEYTAGDVDRDGTDGWLSRNPPEVQRRFGRRWLTTDFRRGDVLCFSIFMLHCSLDNASPEGKLRLSSDSRYQLAAAPIDERWIGPDPIAHGGR